jgi:hypothetical protein
LLVWSFAVVPFAVATVAVFCVNDKNDSAKQKLGPVSWNEILKITGGAMEATDRCGETEVDCGSSNHGGTCNVCDEKSATTNWKEDVSYTEYSGNGTITAVGDGDDNKSGSVNNFNINCTRKVQCVRGNLVDPGHCSGSSCENTGAFQCYQYSAPTDLPSYTQYNKGQCVDP